MSVIDRVRASLADSGLIPPGSRVLVGYSGGPDSTALLTILAALEVEIVAAHLHHGQREAADAEELRCREYAERLGVEFAVGRADVPLIARQTGVGLEEAGRNARESFFRQALHATGCDLIATGHTRSDRVETMLFHLARGTGLAGLASIPASRDRIVRPLLGFDREETVAFCRDRGLEVVEDPANTDPAFSRARIRHRVVPELIALNPRFPSAAERLMDLAREEDDFLDSAAAAALEAVERPVNGPLGFLTRSEETVLDRASLAAFPPVLRRRAVRLVACFLGAELDHDSTFLLDGYVTGEPGSVTVEGGQAVIEVSATKVHGRRLDESGPFRHPLTVYGETEADSFGWSLVAAPQGSALPDEGVSADLGMGANLHFRSFQDGDRIDGRKVADLFEDLKLTRLARRRIPVVCDLVGPVWVPGSIVAERARGDRLRLWLGPSGLAPRP